MRKPGFLVRLWMRLSPVWDEAAEQAARERQDDIARNAIAARIRSERAVAAYRRDQAALRRRP